MKTKMWALIRDGEIWHCFHMRMYAEQEMKLVRPGSKHNWWIEIVSVTRGKP